MWGALRWSKAEIGAQGLSQGIGSVMAVGSPAKTMTSPINYTDRVSRRLFVKV